MNKTVIIVAGVALAAGLGGGYWLAQQGGMAGKQAQSRQAGERKPLFYRHPMNPSITSPVPAKDEMGMDYIPVYAEESSKARKPLFYRHPMNPSITSPVPAKDEMGMDYIPVYADGDGAADEPAGTVKIDPVTVQNIGVRTARAERRVLTRKVRTAARVSYDEEHLARLHPKVEGWIEKMRVDKTGEQVKKDQILLSIYSPQLVASQEEYLLAIKNYRQLKNSPFADIRRGAAELVKSSRQRLELLDMAEHQIRELEESGRIKRYVHIHSPFDGVVIKVGAREGQFVTPKTELYNIADLSRVWVYVDVFEDELPWVQVGDEAEMRVAAIPGRVFRGRITYIYPYFETKTRTVKVRMEFDNPQGLLKPEMFADVTIHAGRKVSAVVVPEQAIVRSGSRELVFVVRGPGKFEPREVEVGVSSSGWTQILRGLKHGEEVVTSAQFLIDSESKLREATAKMLESAAGDPASGKAPARDHDAGHKMNMEMHMDMKGQDGMKMDMKKPQGRDKGGAMSGMQHETGATGHKTMDGSQGGMKHD
ncbi:MAG TPA: efflux RND transporter periplasmic adaptor subunit [Gammaproteobacteria bacterium]|nr:efflux RND transporter periplasmic adaptor subunit [Gammaproteobacteria bacterium]